MTRDDAVDAALALAAVGLHLGAAAYLDRLPPDLGIDLLLVVLPVLLGVVAVVALLVRADRRPLQVACTAEWLLVLFTLPAFGLGLAFVPAAAVLSVAVLRPRVSSARPVAG
ncbi:MAG: hypothetical protein JWN08_629 [Frankiales bacterium]|jgi:uncharacterized membrane protein (UPF0136 family)|nr:hypothetical protein [Frankiales bacterium]